MSVLQIKGLAPWSGAERIIRTVPHYRNVEQIMTEKVSPAMLRPICLYVRKYRFDRVKQLIQQYSELSIPLFEPLYIGNGDASSHRIITPPIVEVHGDQYVIIDGLHRVFESMELGNSQIIVAVVRGSLPDLPADILTWADVQITEKKLPRSEKFRNLDETQFREIHRFIDNYD